MDEWTPVAVLPNVELEASAEGGLAALVPSEDARVLALATGHSSFRKFLDKFTDAFGVRHRPGVLLIRSDAPRSVFTAEAIASFRDAVSVAAISYSRTLELKHPRGHRIQYANTFSIYPWMLDKNYKHLIARTPAILGLHDVAKFKGQLSPEIFHMRLSSSAIDEPLLHELLVRWRRRYASRNPQWPERALFRSLNMANQASMLPAGPDTTLHDFGRLVALWVSAFEILAHPGEGKSGLFSVYDLIDKVEWQSPAARARRYRAHEANRKNSERRCLANWLYGELYKARNDFLHGNPLPDRRLFLKPSGRSLFPYAASLYRLALTGFLPLTWTTPFPPASAAEEFGRHVVERSSFLGYQRAYEEGVRTAREKGDRGDDD